MAHRVEPESAHLTLAAPLSVPLFELLNAAYGRLEAAGVDSPRLSADLLACRVLSLDRVGLFLNKNKRLAPAQVVTFRGLVARRAAGEPVAYLLGEKEFYGLEFKVTPDVLIPRPETEHLVEQALALFPRDAELRYADCGTGSGCLAVTLATLYAHCRALAVDTSPAALAVARINAQLHGVGARVLFVQADFSALPCADGALDLVLANPPYVSTAEYLALSREVRDFEPQSALVPTLAPQIRRQSTGLESFAAVMAAAARALRPAGVLLLEIGCTQAAAIRALCAETAGERAGPRPGSALWSTVRILPDLAGLDRVAAFTRSL